MACALPTPVNFEPSPIKNAPVVILPVALTMPPVIKLPAVAFPVTETLASVPVLVMFG